MFCNILILSFPPCRCLLKVGGGKPHRHPSGIIGSLLREYYPGLVTTPNGNVQPAWTWDHYKLAKDESRYDHVADRVLNEFWVSFFDTSLVNTKMEQYNFFYY